MGESAEAAQPTWTGYGTRAELDHPTSYVHDPTKTQENLEVATSVSFRLTQGSILFDTGDTILQATLR